MVTNNNFGKHKFQMPNVDIVPLNIVMPIEVIAIEVICTQVICESLSNRNVRKVSSNYNHLKDLKLAVKNTEILIWLGFKWKFSRYIIKQKKTTSPGWPQIYCFNQFKLNFLKNYSNSTFLCWKTRSPTLYCLKRKKLQFVQIQLLVENRLNGEFYWPNVFHYRFKIQSLTWNLHCRSHNLQPASTS